jgi:hypothetical protein
LSIIAHSLGGVLARAWCEAAGRLVQLGTPNGGSYPFPFMLVGRDDTVALALIDLKHSRTELPNLIAAFPGVLELLPRSAISSTRHVVARSTGRSVAAIACGGRCARELRRASRWR